MGFPLVRDGVAQKSFNNSKLVVYTIALGWNYELPKVKQYKNVDYICLTDKKITSTNGWICRFVTPLFYDDMFRSSREPKSQPQLWFPEYSRSLYIDTTVQLKHCF